MCLGKIYEYNLDREGEGYKVFRVQDGKLFGEIFGTNKEKKVREWIDSGEGEMYVKGESIPKGFHVFLNESNAINWHSYYVMLADGGHVLEYDHVIQKVKFRKGHTAGTQLDHHARVLDVVIAKEIYIL